MKRLLMMATTVFTAMACSQAPKECEKETAEEAQKETFVEANIPEQGLDMNTYSTGIQHIGIPTTEIQRTVEFYEGLGFKQAMRTVIPDGREFVFMQLGNLLLEIIPTDQPAMQNGAVDHFCMDVKNIEEVYTKLKEAGYTMLDENVNEIGFWEKGAKYFFILGPNNEKIEFCEIL